MRSDSAVRSQQSRRSRRSQASGWPWTFLPPGDLRPLPPSRAQVHRRLSRSPLERGDRLRGDRLLLALRVIAKLAEVEEDAVLLADHLGVVSGWIATTSPGPASPSEPSSMITRIRPWSM